MAVSDPLAFDLLRAFAQLEFRLKEDPGFLRAGPYRMAQVNWQAVDTAVAQLPGHRFLDRASDETRTMILAGPRDRPMVQEVDVVGGQNAAVFKRLALQASDAGALVEAARRVRNNLFHGGKEQPDVGDDEEWARAASEIADLLLDLLDRRELRPVSAP
ncbi:MAG TPA: hypothetical protein VMA55_16055 [Acidovorax sp.]|nr:hypothetical protein [Acidovorax sp.]